MDNFWFPAPKKCLLDTTVRGMFMFVLEIESIEMYI